MKDLVRYSRSRIWYTGRVDRSIFILWCKGAAARPVVTSMAAQVGFAPFGRLRAARRRLWSDVAATARSEVLTSLCQGELDAYVTRVGLLAHAHDLPRIDVALHRLIVVPRLLAHAAIDRHLDRLLESMSVFATAHGCTAVRDWFILSVISAVERAIVSARPSPNQPFAAGDEWNIIGVNDGFEWRVPFDAAAWNGHYYVFERTCQPITRAVLKAARDGVARFESSLPSLSRLQRDEILQRAGRSSAQLLARYDTHRDAVGS